MVRQILFSFCFVTVTLLAFINAPFGIVSVKQTTQVLAQVSPLASPLTLTVATTTGENTPTASQFAAPANGSPISVVLVAAVFVGIIVVLNLVIWRRR